MRDISALAGVNGDVWTSISPSVALASPETCTDSGDHTFYSTSVHKAWDKVYTLTVQCSPNGSTSWATVTDYVFWYPMGVIKFNSARVVGTNNFVRIQAGHYVTLSSLDGAHSWTMNMKGTVKEITPFQAPGAWSTNAPTLKSLTFNVDCFRQDGRLLSEMITSGTGKINISGGVVLCQLWHDKTNGDRWQFFAFPTGISETVAVQDIDKQTISFQSNGPLYLATSNTLSTTTVIRA